MPVFVFNVNIPKSKCTFQAGTNLTLLVDTSRKNPALKHKSKSQRTTYPTLL